MDLIKALLSSKKFIAAIIGGIVAIGARYGLKLDPDMVDDLVKLFLVYIGAQGLADFRKQEAKVNAIAAENSSPQAEKAIEKL